MTDKVIGALFVDRAEPIGESLDDDNRYALHTKSNISTVKLGGVISEIVLNSTTWTPLPASALTKRKAICIQNRSGKEIKINYTQPVGYTGIVIPDGGERFYDAGPEIIFYAKSSAAAATINIEEIA